jgi:MFS superfamily sulfate permease-like transporter
MPSYETRAGTLWPTLALTASLCRGRARPRQRNSAFQPGVEAVIVLAARWAGRRIPSLLIAVIAAIIAGRAADLAGRGVAVLGPIPRGLPHLGLPALSWHDAAALIGTAISLFVVILAQNPAASRAYAEKYQEADANPGSGPAVGQRRQIRVR